MRRLFRRLFGGSSGPEQSGADESSDDIYPVLRRQALSIQRTDVDIPEPPPEALAWGILMETGYPGGTATLLALGDGTSSLYLSTGGGVVGGHGHQNVREANAEFVEAANGLLCLDRFQCSYRGRPRGGARLRATSVIAAIPCRTSGDHAVATHFGGRG